MDLSCFGIEFETCVCDTSNKTGIYDNQKYRDRLQALNDTLGIGAKFEYSPDPEFTNYGVWMITSDYSIECGISDSRFLKANRQVVKSADCRFVSTELVSPKTAYTRDEYTKFTRVLNEVVLNHTFEYDINESQGMHTNISHPDQDKLRMLKAWWYFEPVILSFVPPKRRRNVYAIPLRERFKTIAELVESWETFYTDPESPPAKFTALCVKQNWFEVRIVPADMTTDHVTAWLTFCIRFLFASITKSVDFDFTLMPTIEDLFEFVDVDASNPVDNLRDYFYSLDTVKHCLRIRGLINSYSMLELIKSGNEVVFSKLASESPDTVLTMLKGCIPIIPSLNLLKFFRILLTRYLKIPGSYDVVILEFFDENMTPITRAYDPVFYREYVDFADHTLAIEILKTSIKLKDCETVNMVARRENCKIYWDDIIELDSEWLIDCYENPEPPSSIEFIKSWRVARKILDRYPDIKHNFFSVSWIEPDIISEQFELILGYDNAVNISRGFEYYTTSAICEGSHRIIPKLLPVIPKIINTLTDSNAVKYINKLFLCENATVNAFIETHVLHGNIKLCELIIDILVKLSEINFAISSELINNCLRVIPRHLILGKYKMIDDILSITFG